MTILENIRDAICNQGIESCKKRHVYLAYIMLHMNNPAIHPDDHLSEDGGYEGYMVILADWVINHDNLPDTFHYPCTFARLPKVLEELDTHHDNQLTNENPDSLETILHNTMLCDIHFLMDFMKEMKPSELDGAVDTLQKLYLYHADENDSAEEESEKLAGILKDCADVLNWIQHQ